MYIFTYRTSNIYYVWVFAEYCLFYRTLLQNRPINLSILLTDPTNQSHPIRVPVYTCISLSIVGTPSCGGASKCRSLVVSGFLDPLFLNICIRWSKIGIQESFFLFIHIFIYKFLYPDFSCISIFQESMYIYIYVYICLGSRFFLYFDFSRIVYPNFTRIHSSAKFGTVGNTPPQGGSTTINIYMYMARTSGSERRSISHWNWKLRIVPRVLGYPPEKLSFQFSTHSGSQVSFWRKRHILEYPVPIP